MSRPHERLDRAMNQRRLELHMNWREVARGAGISYEALRAIRRGDSRPTELTARGIDAALQWAPGSVLKVLKDGAPTPVEVAEAREAAREALPEPGDGPPNLSQELEVAYRVLLATVDALKLTPEEADEAWRRVRRKVEQTHRQPEAGENPRHRRAG